MCELRNSIRRHGMSRFVLIWAAAATLLCSAAHGQVLYGSLVGNVTDAAGAAVPDANVKVTHSETNESREAKTNESGAYTVSTLPAGSYTVAITKEGFRTYSASSIQVRLNTVVRVDATLQVGALTESINVTAEAAALQTDRADVHGEFTTKAMVDIPQPTRSYQGVLALMPGVAPPTVTAGGQNNPGKSFKFYSNGGNQLANTVRIDGVTDTNPWVAYYSTYVPSIEAIETVNAVTGSGDAEQGMVSGAAINVQTKSGTNALHGSLYEYHVNGEFKARPFFLPSNQGIPKLIENDLGGSLGGRIIKDKLFFFGSYEGDFISQAASGTYTVPTTATRSGNLTGSATPIYDPQTGNPDGTGRTAFPNNTIPANRISPIAQKMIGELALPNVPGNPLVANYYVATPLFNRLHRLDTKMDWNASNKLRFTGRFGFQPYNVQQVPPFGPLLAGPVQTSQYGNVIATSVGITYTATPTLVIDGNWGLTRAHQVLDPPSSDKKLASDWLGIPGTNLGDLPVAGGLPQFLVSGYTTLGYNYPYLQYIDPVLQYTANATWIKGSHNVRFGVDLSQQRVNHTEVPPTQFTFTGGITALPGGAAANQYNSYGDFLLALPQSYQSTRLAGSQETLRTWQASLYVRDQWQVSRKLTLTYGLRWEYYPVPKRAERGLEVLDTSSLQILLCGVSGNPSDCGIHVSKRLFSPRVGLAYRPTSTWVVRAGFALNPEAINMGRDSVMNYPEVFTYAATGPSSYLPVVSNLSAGVPVQPPVNTSSGKLPLPAGISFTTIPQNYIRGYTESWNFTLQKDLGHNWIAQAGYVGTHTVHMHMLYNVNYGQVGGGAASQPFAKYGITSALSEVLPYGAMNYNSLQASLQRRFANGVTMQASYTRSKWMGLCCDDIGYSSIAIPIPQYWQLNRSVMPADRPDNFRMSGLYELPFGHGKTMVTKGVAAWIAGGWQLNGVLSLYSGAPFTVTSSAASLNAPGSAQRADQVKSNVQILGTPSLWFDTSAFAPVTQTRFGTAGFDSLRGPGVANLDLSVFRAFRVSERWNVQFRAEALNATNTPHFANPNANVSAGGFGQIVQTSAPSRLVDERYLRFGLRISF